MQDSITSEHSITSILMQRIVLVSDRQLWINRHFLSSLSSQPAKPQSGDPDDDIFKKKKKKRVWHQRPTGVYHYTQLPGREFRCKLEALGRFCWKCDTDLFASYYARRCWCGKMRANWMKHEGGKNMKIHDGRATNRLSWVYPVAIVRV